MNSAATTFKAKTVVLVHAVSGKRMEVYLGEYHAYAWEEGLSEGNTADFLGGVTMGREFIARAKRQGWIKQ